MNSQSIESQPFKGEIKSARSGAISSTETGMSTAYSIKTIQELEARIKTLEDG